MVGDTTRTTLSRRIDSRLKLPQRPLIWVSWKWHMYRAALSKSSHYVCQLSIVALHCPSIGGTMLWQGCYEARPRRQGSYPEITGPVHQKALIVSDIAPLPIAPADVRCFA